MKIIKNIKIIDPGTSPDVDTDFHTEGRYKTLEYVTNKYGHNSVASIITPGPFKARKAFKSVATVYDLPFNTSNKISDTLPDSTSEVLIKDLLDISNQEGADFRALIKNDELLEDIAKYSANLQGRQRETGVHACGILISSEDLTNTIPLQFRQSDNQSVTQWNYYDCEALGLIKMDFLGLDTVDLISNAVKNIKYTKGIDLDMNEIVNGDLNDLKTYQLFQNAETTGIFQFSSSGVKKMLLDLKPTEFMDLASVTALYRPGPMGMGLHEEFAKRKRDESLRIPVHVDFKNTRVEEILSKNYACLIYQEDVMNIAKECAGFTPREADDLRKAIGKKKRELMESLGDKFKEGMIKNGYPKEAVETLWEGIVEFASYSFNKSHSVSYALNAYQAAYLKANYPVEFMAAYLKQKSLNRSDIPETVSEIRRMGIKILPASINESYANVTPSKTLENTIIYGFNAVKKLSSNVAEAILKERKEKGRFKSIDDFVKRMLKYNVIKSNTIKVLANIGAFDEFNIPRKAICDSSNKLLVAAEKDISKSSKPGLFSREITHPQLVKFSNEEYTFTERAKNEVELTDFFLSNHLLDFVEQNSVNLEELDNIKENFIQYVVFADVEYKTTRYKNRYLETTLDNKISRNIFKVSYKLQYAFKKYNALMTIIKKYYPEYDSIKTALQSPIDGPIIENKAMELLDIKDEDKEKFLSSPYIKEPSKNDVYLVEIGRSNKFNPNSRIEIVNLKPIQLTDKGKLPIIINMVSSAKSKLNLIEDKLKETKGSDVVRLQFSDQTFYDIEDVKFMKGTTQDEIKQIFKNERGI